MKRILALALVSSIVSLTASVVLADIPSGNTGYSHLGPKQVQVKPGNTELI